MPSVLIVGGGLAGLSAAVPLAQRGLAVTLLESRPALGGRTSSFVDPATGETLDNCQHVTMGCCTNLSHFCRDVGVADLLDESGELANENTKKLLIAFMATFGKWIASNRSKA